MPTFWTWDIVARVRQEKTAPRMSVESGKEKTPTIGKIERMKTMGDKPLLKDIYLAERKSGMSVAEIAEKHGVATSTVYTATASAMIKNAIKEIDFSEERIRADCVMFRNLNGKRFCSGLNGLYCAVENCKFYKKKEKKR